MVFNSHGRLRKVLLCEPTYYEICSFSDIATKNIEKGFKASPKVAAEQHKEFTEVFKELEVAIEWEEAAPNHPDLTATRDFGVNTARGVLIGNFRYSYNDGDREIAVETLKRLNEPIVGYVNQGYLEGGDCWYLDEYTLVIGAGNRSDMEGIREAEKVLAPYDIKVIPVQFDPKWNHLDVSFSVAGNKTVLICPEALPEDFVSYIKKQKYTMIEITPEAAVEGAANILALGDDKVLSFKGNKINKQLQAEGFEVYDPDLSQFLLSGTGPHCLSFELARDKN